MDSIHKHKLALLSPWLINMIIQNKHQQNIRMINQLKNSKMHNVDTRIN